MCEEYSGRLAGFNEGKYGARGPDKPKPIDEEEMKRAKKYGIKTSCSPTDLDGDLF